MHGGLTSLSSEVLEQLLQLGSSQELQLLLRERPDIDGLAMWNYLRRSGAVDDPLIAGIVSLVVLIRDTQRGDSERAWSTYQHAKAHLNRQIADLHTAVEGIETMVNVSQFDEALDRIGRVEALAESTGQILALIHLLSIEGRAAVLSRSANRAANLERAGVAFSRGMRLARSSAQRGPALAFMMDLATFFAERVTGDYVDDLPSAERLLREVIAEAPEDYDEPVAMCRTNLATVLLRLNRPSVEQLIEARDLCIQALVVRELATNPMGWAYSQIVLGDVFNLLSEHDYPEGAVEAESRYQLVIDSTTDIPDPNLVAHANFKLGTSRFRRWRIAHNDPDTAAGTIPLVSIIEPLNQAFNAALDPALKGHCPG